MQYLRSVEVRIVAVGVIVWYVFACLFGRAFFEWSEDKEPFKAAKRGTWAALFASVGLVPLSAAAWWEFNRLLVAGLLFLVLVLVVLLVLRKLH